MVAKLLNANDMIINLTNVKKKQKVAIALGYFDAIHMGHQNIFEEILSSSDAISSVFTFSNDMYKLLGREIKEIYTFDERCKLIHSYGIKHIYYLNATFKNLSLDGESFLDMLMNRLDIDLIVSGEDYTYGKDAKCNVENLAEYAKKNNIRYIAKPLIMQNNQKVSSSAIRNFLSTGDMLSVKKALNRYYSVTEKVYHGRKSGKAIGFPTINLPLDSNLQPPKYGVYISNVILGNKKYKSITNIGPHPTFADFSANIETHIIDYEANLYGKTVVVELIEYLREVQGYSTIKELVEQINKDVRYRKNYD